jgi:hypothetical protein
MVIMVLQFGKHIGMSVERLVLTQPDYVAWMLGQEGATGQLSAARREAARLIRRFDQKPFIEPCRAPGCGNVATRGSVYVGSVRLVWWCESCAPDQLGASPSKLSIIRTYLDAVSYVNMCCGGNKQALKVLIKELDRAKGLPERVSEPQAVAFFR